MKQWRTALALILMGCPIGASRAQAPEARVPPDLPAGITAEAYAAIERGLSYLAQTQDRQGAWSNQGRYGAYPVAMTSLAGLALLMDGNTPTQGRFAPQVDRAVRYVMASAQPDGLIGRTDHEGRPMYGHGFSMLFLAEVHGMLDDPGRQKEIHDILARAVTLTARAQTPAGGWYYTPDSRTDEGSVTITQVQALRACRNAGVAVPKETIDQAMRYLVQSQNSDGGIRYSLSQRMGASRPAITAAAVCCWFNAGEYGDPHAKRALAFSKTSIRPQGAVGGHDFYAHLYLAQALFVSNDDYWGDYFPKRRDILIVAQRPDGSWWGDGVGDIYGTALALIVLQLPYNSLPIMQQ